MRRISRALNNAVKHMVRIVSGAVNTAFNNTIEVGLEDKARAERLNRIYNNRIGPGRRTMYTNHKPTTRKVYDVPRARHETLSTEFQARTFMRQVRRLQRWAGTPAAHVFSPTPPRHILKNAQDAAAALRKAGV